MRSDSGDDGHDHGGDRGFDFASNKARIARRSWFFAKDDNHSMKWDGQSRDPQRSTSRLGERKIGERRAPPMKI